MTVEIDIIDRVYYGIVDFCEVNEFDVKEYMSDAVMEKYNIDKYGDLNEKLVKKVEKKPTVRKPKKEQKVEIIGKKEDEQDIGTQVEKDQQGETKEETVSEKLGESPIVVQTDDAPVKKVRRTLKTK